MKKNPEELSKVIRHSLYTEIVKGRRSSKGNRWLSFMWPNTKEEKTFFKPTSAYLNHIGPGDIAGNHFHESKREFFCPLGDLTLFLYDTKAKRTTTVRMSVGSKNKYSMYYIPPGVPHAVKNETKKFQSLVVLTNVKDYKGKTRKLIFVS